ncbi:eukaryotic translation initiation factor 3 subunit J [Monodelphis domestica]|uniref:eukaryotic translation initiation factor 3 subunit J n=1 Tax=Monodelphis domestica TaxID=13616 RepID=UPI0000F2B280|nr:eukaryotic translation initiation factor 3 subunit J [Monodelphis domestica]XP_056666360.1 eukaryotic translation initiation factor 3 subunit J [Monodelphis domestica]
MSVAPPPPWSRSLLPIRQSFRPPGPPEAPPPPPSSSVRLGPTPVPFASRRRRCSVRLVPAARRGRGLGRALGSGPDAPPPSRRAPRWPARSYSVTHHPPSRALLPPSLPLALTHTRPEMAAAAGDSDSWDADTFSVEEPVRKAGGAAGGDRWEGEDEDDDVKENWDDDDEEKKEETEVKPETKVSEKKKIAEKIKEKERQQKKRQEEIKKRLEEPEESKELTPEEQLADKLRLKKLQEEADLELAKETFGVNNTVCGIDAMNPSSRDDFTEFGKLLKDKITQYEKSLYYASFLEALVRDVCISLEIDDLKKITNSLTVLCSEKQKQEKQSKAKKKKKGVVPGGGLKATMKDDLADYGGYDGGYVQDFEDFM